MWCPRFCEAETLDYREVRAIQLYPILAGGMGYQVSGWLSGKRIFESLNSEALFFTFLALSLIVIAWLVIYSSSEGSGGRILVVSLGSIGLVLGIGLRIIEK